MNDPLSAIVIRLPAGAWDEVAAALEQSPESGSYFINSAIVQIRAALSDRTGRHFLADKERE